MNVRAVEIVVKGFANHHRIRILTVLEIEPGLSLLDISDKLKINFRTTSEHTKKLVAAGLIAKKYKGSTVEHALTDQGKRILRFCKTI